MAIDSTVRWFHSEQADAPQIDCAATSELIAILDACLLNGFDSNSVDSLVVTSDVATVTIDGGHDYEKHAVIRIAGATPAELNGDWRIATADATTFTFATTGITDQTATGTITAIRATPGYWEKAFSDTDKAAYRSTHPDATGLYFRINDWAASTGGIRIRGFESMTDVDTGTRPFPTEAQESTYRWRKSSTTSAGDLPRPWTLVADESFVWFFIDFNNVETRPATMYHFGDVAGRLDDAYRFVITGHTTATPGFPGSNTDQNDFSGSSSAGCYFARNAAGAETNPSLYVRHGRTATASPGDGPAFPDNLTGGYLFSPAMAGSNNTATSTIMRGLVPGILQSWTDAESTLGSDVRRVLDPTTHYDRAVMVVAVTSAAFNQSHVGVDIWGPWR